MTNEEQNVNLVLNRMEEICRKAENLEHPSDFNVVNIGLTDEEKHFLNVFRNIANLALFAEFNYIHDFLRNHHHVTLGVANSVEFRKNGNKVAPHHDTMAVNGTVNNENE